MSNLYIPRSQKGIFANILLWVVAVLLAVGVIIAILWALGVFTAPVRGQAGAFQQKEGANNRIFAQQNFEQENADIRGFTAKIAAARLAFKETPTDINQTNLQGLIQQCINTVQSYNADARKYLLRDFRSAGLPSRQGLAQCS